MARRLSGSVKRTDTVLVTSVDVASADITGVLPVANGGTGSGSFTDGQLLIGNTASGNTLTKATLTAGSGISVTNGGGSITIAATGGGGLTNWAESAGTYSSKDWKRFYPVSGTNVNAVFSPLGTGSIQAQVADGTSAGGNQRGSNAVDWQRVRSMASQVASGSYSAICGGRNNQADGNSSLAAGGYANTASGLCAVATGGKANTASGNYSAVGGGRSNSVGGQLSAAGGGKSNNVAGDVSFIGGGDSNSSAGDYACIGGGKSNNTSQDFASILGGRSNIASAAYASVCGGKSNTASGSFSTVIGGLQATTRGIYGCVAGACGRFGTDGDAQWRSFVLRALTTGVTTKALTSDDGAAGTTNQIVLPNNSAYTFRALIIAHRTDVVSGWTHRASWTVDGAVARDANAASTIVSAVINTITNTPGWTLAVTADTTNGAVAFTFTGAASQTIRTVAVVQTCEVTS